MATRSHFQKFWRPLIKFAILHSRYCAFLQYLQCSFKKEENEQKNLTSQQQYLCSASISVPSDSKTQNSRSLLSDFSTVHSVTNLCINFEMAMREKHRFMFKAAYKRWANKSVNA